MGRHARAESSGDAGLDKAIDATQKVASGYEAELVPADKLRRAPEPIGKRGRRAKVATDKVAPLLPLSAPQSMPDSIADKSPGGNKEDDVPLPAPVAKRGRKAADAVSVNNIPPPEVDKVATGSKSTGRKVLSGAATESNKEPPKPDTSRKRGATSKKRKAAIVDVVSSNEASQEADGKPEEDVLAAPQVRKTRKAVSELNEIDQADEEHKPAATTPPTTAEPIAPAVEKAKGPRKETAKKRPTKTRRALAESDVNIFRPSPLKAADKHDPRENPSAESKKDLDRATTRPSGQSKESQRSRTVPPAGQSVISPEPTQPPKKLEGTKRSRKVQATKQPIATPEPEPASSKPSISKRRHVIVCEEDLDWLDEKADNKRSCPTTTRHAIHKSRRQETDHGAKDIDLDDLLESIAGFSGKLLTGKRGRAVAS